MYRGADGRGMGDGAKRGGAALTGYRSTLFSMKCS